ncbi:cytochrome b [Dongshaea marina]|uniref:cytochrome b n=1 Tax=Dongshaea marina TaxID=2047966 RepID=UPI000D3E087F|nr:cytochrome b [Dongshaea marina]
MPRRVIQYNSIGKLNHWLSAVVVIGLFILGLWMVELDYYSSWYQVAPHWHKSIGLCLVFFTLFRLGWKLLTPHPAIQGKRWEIITAQTVHQLLYLLLFILFVSGYLISTADGRSIAVFNWFSIPGAGELFADQADIAGMVHYYTALALISLAGLHALAALKHHFIDRDNTLKKMIGGVKDEN